MARMNTEFGRTVVTVTEGEYAIIAQIATALRRGGEDGLRALLSTQTTDSRMLVYGGVATYDHRLSAQIEQTHPGLVQGILCEETSRPLAPQVLGYSFVRMLSVRAKEELI